MKTRKITLAGTVTVNEYDGKLIVRAYELLTLAVARGDMGPAIALGLLSLETGKKESDLMAVMAIAMRMYYNHMPTMTEWDDPYAWDDED